MEKELISDKDGQLSFNLDNTSNPLCTVKERDEEREIEIDLDILRQALASNDKTCMLKVKVIGKEVSVVNKILGF